MESTRSKVLKVIKEMQFKPNTNARSLVVKQTNIIEAFFSWAGQQTNFQSDWYTKLLLGINEGVEQKHYSLLVNTISGVFAPQTVYKKVFQSEVDGVLMISPYLEENEILKMMENRIPIVLIGYRAQDSRIDYIDSDNIQSTSLVVEHLTSLGHQRIAIISGPTRTSQNAEDRLEGFRQALTQKGLALPPDYVVEGNYLKESGAQAMQKLLSLSNRPTAVFASNDLMAMGAWDVLIQNGIQVGSELSLVGFDDIPEAGSNPYSLTTIRQDYRNISLEATEVLIAKIKSFDDWKPRQILIPTHLVVRNSTGPLPALH